MKDERLIIAVDGGATKTTLVIQSENCRTLFTQTSTGSNYHAIGSERVERVLSGLLQEAHEAIPFANIEIATFAMAGIDTDYDLAIIKGVIEKSLSNTPITIKTIIIENDVHSTLLGITKGNPGALLLSGTGSICYAYDGQHQMIRTGGWGHRAADEGSGYWIGRKILRAVVRFEDGRSSKPTILKQLLFDKLQVKHLDQLLAWVYHPEYTNAELASISSIISEAVALGDEAAIEIARSAAKELSILTMATLKKLTYLEEPFTVYINGGLLQNHPIIRDLFEQYTLEHFPNLLFELCHKQPIEYIINRALLELK
nr:BadF/BadG/BcrA/BcrD ATPase family protein [Lysinibacillus timonensis]